MNKNRIVFLPIIMAILLVAGIYIGHEFNFNQNDQRFFIYPQTNKLNSILNYIDEEYVDSVSKDQLIEEAIPKILEELDPHSVYIPAKELTRTNESLHGAFDGIGVQFNIHDDTVVILRVIPDGPSEYAGLAAGDRIVKVNDSLIAGVHISNDGVMKLLKGPGGTTVNVGIARRGMDSLLTMEITRGQIPINSVDVAYMIDDSTGFIKISRFSSNTYHEFVNAANRLLMNGMKNMILDLRGNSGGYMEVATSIVDEFLEQGQLIVYTKGKSRPRNDTWSSSRGICKKTGLVVLLDELSASASEIVAGAIQDNDRGLIVGRRSFGKGLVQEQTQFPDHSALRLTIARYYTPTGRCIQKSYKNGIDDYYQDMHKRFAHGEFNSADSIHFPDSLKYKTPAGKTVYGGGGIMPDIFVPIDTNGVSPYFNTIQNKGIIYSFAFEYVDQRRNKLLAYQNYKELLAALEQENLLKQFISFAEKEGIPTNPKEMNYSRDLIQTLLYAQIIRNVFDDEGFYPVIQNIDEALKQAIRAIHEHSIAELIGHPELFKPIPFS